jgi:phospholipase C
MAAMSPINRRGFLAPAGGATAMATLSPSIARAAAVPADRRTGSIQDTDHIVVLMQENRSFDHYFGSLRAVRGFGDRTPVTLPDGRPVWNQSGILPFRPEADDLGRSSFRTWRTAGTTGTTRSPAAATTTGCRPRRRPRWPT